MKKTFLAWLGFLSLFHISSCEEFFKVPFDEQQRPKRDEERPPRLVDTSDDPDVKKIKVLEEKFFKVAQNTTLTKEFKSFQDLLQLIDSDAGKELGRLFFNGILFGMGKENSNQLLVEFWDEFQYRISPDLSHALKDYYDFMKGVDFSLIPMTMQMMFQKDHLGNSLAHMPLGQLVDLIQPEASKYGIDIRGMINGILGKDGSKFPELVEKFLFKMNMTNMLSSITSSVMDEGEIAPEDSNKIEQDIPNKKKRKSTNKILNLFKPFISKILKDNKVDLEPDAIINVVTPFVTGGGEMINKMIQENFGSSNGKGFDFTKLLPLLGMLGMGGPKKGGSKQGAAEGTESFDPAQLLNMLAGMAGLDQGKEGKGKGGGFDISKFLPLLGMLGGGSKKGQDFDLTQILGMFSGIQDSKTNERNGKPGGFDFSQVAQLLPLLGNLGSGSKSKDGDLGNTLSMLASVLGDGNSDLSSIVNSASQLLGSNSKQPKAASNKKEETLPNNILEKLNSEEFKELFANIGTGENVLNSDVLKKMENLPKMMNELNAKLQDISKITEEIKDLKNMEQEGESIVAENEIRREKAYNNDLEKFSGFERSIKFRDVLKALVKKAKKDKESHHNFGITLNKMKSGLREKIASLLDPQWFNAILPLMEKHIPADANVEAFQRIFSFSRHEWETFFTQLRTQDIRAIILQSANEPAVLVAEMFHALSFSDLQKNAKLGNYINGMFTWLDLTDVTLENFPDRLKSLAGVLTKGYHIPIDLTLLLEPLQGLIIENIQWYNSRIQHNKQLQKEKLRKAVYQSLNDDFVESALLLKKLHELSSLPEACIPKAICNVIKKASSEEDSHLRKIIITLGSLSIGLFNEDDDVVANLDVILASLGSKNCESSYDKGCESSKKRKSQKQANKKSSEAKKTKDTHHHKEL